MPILTDKDCERFVTKVRNVFGKQGIPTDGIDYRVEDYDDWSIWLLIPYNICPSQGYEELDFVSPLLAKACGVDAERCVYFGVNDSDGVPCHEFYLTHPDTPKEVLDRLDKRSEEEMRQERFLVPHKPRKESDEAYVVLAEKFYDAIESGVKKVEYRDYTQYYVDKLLAQPIRHLKMNRGYGHKGIKPKQMVWSVVGIGLADEKGNTYSAYKGGKLANQKDFPENFEPRYIAIYLGQKER